VSHPGSPFWVPSAALQRHANRTATGDPACDWLTYVRARHLPRRLERVLVLGCGSGYLERALARYEGVGRILGVDADTAAVDSAARQAQRAGAASIAYAVLDPARDPLPDGPWSAILANDVLHHLPGVDALYSRIHDALASDGRFVFFEYTGPARFQHPEDRMEIVQRFFRLLPDRWRTEPHTGRLLWRREPIDAARLARESPSEAAESERLVPAARLAFLTEAALSGGGGLLHPLLSGLAANHRGDATEDERLIEVLCAAEAHLAATGVLPPAFTVFVGRRRHG
jgi:SAM-dependent methyltransferase